MNLIGDCPRVISCLNLMITYIKDRPEFSAQILNEIIINMYYLNDLITEDTEIIIEKCFNLYIIDNKFEEAKDLLIDAKDYKLITTSLYKKLKSKVASYISGLVEENKEEIHP